MLSTRLCGWDCAAVGLGRNSTAVPLTQIMRRRPRRVVGSARAASGLLSIGVATPPTPRSALAANAWVRLGMRVVGLLEVCLDAAGTEEVEGASARCDEFRVSAIDRPADRIFFDFKTTKMGF